MATNKSGKVDSLHSLSENYLELGTHSKPHILTKRTWGLLYLSIPVLMDQAESMARFQSLEISIQQLSIKDTAAEITEDNLRNMFKMFKQFVTEKNIPECKKFINSYVDKVIVYKDHLEVTFKVALSFEQKNNIYSFNTSVRISNLFKTYRKAAGM